MTTPAYVLEMPLEGVKVVELGNFVSGPYCARLLADSGAEVIKVEPPEGDEARRRGPFPDDIPDPSRSGLYLYLNANKLGIALDTRSPKGRAVLMGLLEDADILVENNSPREMAEQGLDFPSLHKEHPHLIVTSITAFGQTGPYRDYLGDDLVAVNMGGLAYSTPGLPDSVEDPDSEPPLRPATYAGDFAAAISGAVATMLALFGKERSGVGRHVDVSVQEAVAATMIWDLAPTSYLGLVRRRGTRLGYGPMPNCYLPCKDGYVVLTAFSDEHWAKLVEIMGNPDWAESELFDSPTARADSWDGLRLLILEWTMAHTGQEISEATQFQGIPCFPAFDVGQALATEQIAARRYLRETDIGGGRAAQLPGLPFRFGDSPLPLRREAPALGQHTTEVLYERLGYGGPELERLRRLGVI